MHPLKDAEDARRMVRYWAQDGVTWCKGDTTLTRAELGAAIDEAHKNGIKVTAHLCSVGFREAVELGIDNLEHGLLTNTEFYSGKKLDECPSATQSEMYDSLDLSSAIELSAGTYCSVSAMLEQVPGLEMEVTYRISDPDSGAETSGAIGLPISPGE